MPRRTRSRPVALTRALREFLATEAASGGDGTGTAAEHNDADVTFAQSMIVHHEQAIEMAQFAADNADSQEVLDLAARIEAAQQPEIEQMQGWLEEWEAKNDDMSGGDHMSGGCPMTT